MRRKTSLIIAVTMLVALTGGLLAGVGPYLWQPIWSPLMVFAALVLCAGIVIGDSLTIFFPVKQFDLGFNVSSALNFAAALSLGPLWGAIIAIAGSTLNDLLEKRAPIKMIVNASNYGLQTFIAGWIYYSFANPQLSPLDGKHNFVIMLIAAAAASITQSVVLITVVSLAIGADFFTLWRKTTLSMVVEFLAMPTLGALYPVLAHQNPLALVLMIIPLVGPYLAFRNYYKLQQETRETFELLADLLDKRDVYTSEHSQRVTKLVEKILNQFPDLPSAQRETIIAAARIHDLGKIAISDAVLLKPGRLTEEEFEAIKQHPIESSEILGRLTPYREIALIARHHHERWDGTGYPDGLAGEQIPFGARVIAVADTYDAMTSNRSYRRARSHEEAIAEIRRCAGTQFDPVVVEAFLRAVGANEPVPAHTPATTVQPSIVDS